MILGMMHCDDRVHGALRGKGARHIVITGVLEHCDDKDMEHCDVKAMEHSDDMRH